MPNVTRVITWPFNIVFRPEREGRVYKEGATGLTAKAILESLAALLALYAGYSELSQKVLDVLPFRIGPRFLAMGPLIASSVGILLCGYILFSKDPSDNHKLTYSRIPRIVSGVFVWFLLIGLGFSLYNIITTPNTVPEAPFAILRIPNSQWVLKTQSTSTSHKTYVTKITMGKNPAQLKDLGVSFLASKDFAFESIRPDCACAIPAGQQPRQASGSNDESAEWLFLDFHEDLGWQLTVVVRPRQPGGASSAEFPFQATLYLAK